MSHFYCTLHGSSAPGSHEPGRRLASCGGTGNRGLEAILRSSEGAVSVRVYEGEAADGGLEDRVRITFKRVCSWPPEVPPQFVGQEFELYEGPLSECDPDCIRWATHESEAATDNEIAYYNAMGPIRPAKGES